MSEKSHNLCVTHNFSFLFSHNSVHNQICKIVFMSFQHLQIFHGLIKNLRNHLINGLVIKKALKRDFQVLFGNDFHIYYTH